MRTYVCYKVDWEDNHVFDVIVGSNDIYTALKSVWEEYEKDKSKYETGLTYYVEEWQNRERVGWFRLNKETMKLEPYELY